MTIVTSTMTYESIIWHISKNFKESNSIANKLIVIQNRCLRTVVETYRVTFIAVLKIETYISFIAIRLNRLQRNARRRLKQKSRHIKKFYKAIANKLREIKERKKVETLTLEIRKLKWVIFATDSVKKLSILISFWRDLIEKQKASIKEIVAITKTYIKATKDI